MIIGIIAIAKNFAIGRGGKLPWHYSADLKFFKHTTIGNAVVMGSNTWRSIGHPLPERLNVVLSRSNNSKLPSEVMQLASKQEVLDLARYTIRDTYIIGGAQVYREFADVIEKWIVTYVPDDVTDADTFMPSDFLDAFSETASVELGEGLVVKTLLKK